MKTGVCVFIFYMKPTQPWQMVYGCHQSHGMRDGAAVPGIPALVLPATIGQHT